MMLQIISFSPKHREPELSHKTSTVLYLVDTIWFCWVNGDLKKKRQSETAVKDRQLFWVYGRHNITCIYAHSFCYLVLNSSSLNVFLFIVMLRIECNSMSIVYLSIYVYI